jgi:hypothetical protein
MHLFSHLLEALHGQEALCRAISPMASRIAPWRKWFEAHGTVQSAQIIMDRDTGRSKGFGFVEMGQ